MKGEPDPKPKRRARGQIREVDQHALAVARLSGDECAACGKPPANVHHVIPRGSPYFGDDVEANALLICGSGTMGCHGAYHGSPYVDEKGRRWTSEDVRRALGRTITTTRPDTVSYVLDKLGDVAGRDYLRRTYFIEEAA